MTGLSIIIPSYRRADLLAACLYSIQRSRPTCSEVIVVDDASPDHCIERTACAFEGVRVYRLDKRQGFCGAANAGIALATKPIVELLNDDTEVLPGWAEPALQQFDDTRVGAIAPLVLMWEQPECIDSAGDCYFPGGFAFKRGHGERLSAKYLHACEVFGASASSAFYRRDYLLKVGAFPSDFGAYFEDVDLSFRLRRAGYRIVYEPASRVRHHVSASHGRLPDAALLRQQSRNEERVYWRNVPLVTLPLHGAVLAGKALRRWRTGTLTPFIQGRFDAWRELIRPAAA